MPNKPNTHESNFENECEVRRGYCTRTLLLNDTLLPLLLLLLWLSLRPPFAGERGSESSLRAEPELTERSESLLLRRPAEEGDTVLKMGTFR